jgi:D-serine deaminase-like pyridoxal phosphate-dependent protein
MIDHTAQLHSVVHLNEKTSIAPQIFLKINMGSNRAGVIPKTTHCKTLISDILSLEASEVCSFLGLYSHAGHSYSSTSRVDALNFLRQEFEALLVTASTVYSISPSAPLILSVGATPTTTSIRNLLLDNQDTSLEETQAIVALKETITAIRLQKSSIEIHAGVYPTLDIQQLATHALPTTGPHALLTFSDLAFTILAEIASLYPARGPSNLPEALIGAGSLALGREPCKAYPGFAILSPWNRKGVKMPTVGPEEHVGWQVGRISQEHGILTWSGGDGVKPEVLEPGTKVRVWPNHACIAGAGYGWYLIVDETREGKEDEIIDVWPRWRGW